MPIVVCLGSAVRDYVFAVPRLPQGAHKHRASGFVEVGGGPAANAAVAIARLGGRTRLIARVGADAAGAAILADLRAAGVDASGVRSFPGCTSSVSAVMVDAAGERMIVNHLDPRLPADPAWIDLPVRGDCDAALADTRWPEGAQALLRAAANLGIPAVLDADTPVPRDGALLHAATHVAFSAAGLHSYAGEGDPQSLIGRVAAELGRWCCVTLGAQGVVIANAGETRRVAGFPVRAVDTLGAGDVWHGAFAWALARGKAEQDAVVFANAAAALKVQQHGSATSPTREQVERFLIDRRAEEA